jgi:hypothetical protein
MLCSVYWKDKALRCVELYVLHATLRSARNRRKRLYQTRRYAPPSRMGRGGSVSTPHPPPAVSSVSSVSAVSSVRLPLRSAERGARSAERGARSAYARVGAKREALTQGTERAGGRGFLPCGSATPSAKRLRKGGSAYAPLR